MRCIQCQNKKSEREMVYDNDTLEVHCNTCKINGIPVREIEKHLKSTFPSLVNSLGKVSSTRLELDDLIYLFKYAQEHDSNNVSQTLLLMVRQMRKDYPLTDVELITTPFVRNRTNRKDKYSNQFLEERTTVKKAIELETPEPEEKDKNEDVFTL